MRSVLLALLVGGALASPAVACPRGLHCIVLTQLETSRAARVETSAARPPIHLSLRASSTEDVEDLVAPLRSDLQSYEPTAIDPDEVQVPWIWVELRDQVYNRLPRYDHNDQEQQFSMVLAPVVVSSASESTPGLGVSGAF